MLSNSLSKQISTSSKILPGNFHFANLAYLQLNRIPRMELLCVCFSVHVLIMCIWALVRIFPNLSKALLKIKLLSSLIKMCLFSESHFLTIMKWQWVWFLVVRLVPYSSKQSPLFYPFGSSIFAKYMKHKWRVFESS